ncbi:MAG: B12-binding domain-containing radical SAM protein [Candidatus Aminicenantes bacterium]|nr:B12-binding domain-containing radical SAM protein [Candidatus Aminicenantes bacterium]
MGPIVLANLSTYPRRPFLAPPYGLLYVASALDRAGIDVRLYHRKVLDRGQVLRAAEEILALKPVLAGFSTISGPSLIPALAVSKIIKTRTKIPVVWGGLHATQYPEQVLASPWVDYVVVGEGEETAVELARALAVGPGGRFDPASIQGLAFKENGRLRINQSRPLIENLDLYPPAWHHLNIDEYLTKKTYLLTDGGSELSEGRIASILTARGCPWRCTYCYNLSVNQRRYRTHSVDFVVGMAHELRDRHGVEAIHIQDDHFYGEWERAFSIARRLRMPWSSSGRADEVVRWGNGILAELRSTGLRELQIGAESGSPRILKLMKKDVTIEQMFRAAELCDRHGIRVLFSFMTGIPGETDADRRLTCEVMDRLERVGPSIVVNGPGVYFPWPGTPMNAMAEKLGYRPPAKTKDWDFMVWGTRQMKMPFAPGRVRLIEHYRRLAKRTATGSLRIPFFARILISLARFRWKRRFFRFPADYYLPRLVLVWLRRHSGKGAAAVYDQE